MGNEVRELMCLGVDSYSDVKSNDEYTVQENTHRGTIFLYQWLSSTLIYVLRYTVDSDWQTSVSSLKGLEYSALTGTLDSFRFLISCVAPPDGASTAPYISVIITYIIVRIVILGVVFDFFIWLIMKLFNKLENRVSYLNNINSHNLIALKRTSKKCFSS